MTATRLLFVYNADGGASNGLRDVWHRVTSPSTYPCALCKVTDGITGMDRRWREFTSTLGLPVTFLHRDELEAEVGRHRVSSLELPAALIQDPLGVTELLTADDFRHARTVDDLIALVTTALETRAA